MPNFRQIGPGIKKFLGLHNFSPGRADSGWLPGERCLTGPLSQVPCLAEKLKVVGFVSNLEGGGPWSQVSCVPNLVQIVQEMKKFWGLRHSPGRHSVAVGRQGASDGWPASERRLTGPLSRVSESVAGKKFSVFNRLKPNLVCPLGVSVDDRPPTLKKIGQF